MPTVEAGKCSAVDEAKDFWRERMRSAFCESRGCCCVLDAFCTESASSSNSAQDNTYLSGVVDLEGSLAGCVEVPSLPERIVLADQDLVIPQSKPISRVLDLTNRLATSRQLHRGILLFIILLEGRIEILQLAAGQSFDILIFYISTCSSYYGIVRHTGNNIG